MLPDVDADISTYPVGDVVVEVAERPSSPSSRIFDQASAAPPAPLCTAPRWGPQPEGTSLRACAVGQCAVQRVCCCRCL